jgi:hypothetical protein
VYLNFTCAPSFVLLENWDLHNTPFNWISSDPYYCLFLRHHCESLIEYLKLYRVCTSGFVDARARDGSG